METLHIICLNSLFSSFNFHLTLKKIYIINNMIQFNKINSSDFMFQFYCFEWESELNYWNLLNFILGDPQTTFTESNRGVKSNLYKLKVT